MRLQFLVYFLFLLLFSCQSFKKRSIPSSSLVNINVKKKVLSNGLRVLVIENPNVPIFSYYTFFDVGGRYERKGTTGGTHFLEHMMFKGSKNYPQGVFDTFIESSGGSTNAYTSFDSTVYYENLPSEVVDKVISMEADRLQNLLLIPESVEKERSVIREERKLRYENSPRGKLYLTMMQNVFKKTPYGGSVIGSIADLEALTVENLSSFYKTFYTPDNAIIVIAGDVDASDIFEKVEDSFGSIKPSQGLENYKKRKDHPRNYRLLNKKSKNIKIYGSNTKPIFVMAYNGVPITNREGFVLDILSSILGDGESSYYRKMFVKTKKPFLSSVGTWNYTLKHGGVFYISGELLPGVSLNKFKRKLLRANRNLCNRAITERSLQKTKNQYLVKYFDNISSNDGVAHFIGLRELFFGDYRFYKKELKIYQNMKLDAVKRACHKIINKSHIFLSIWNKHRKRKK